MDIMTPLERSCRMRLIRSKDTGPELAVRSLIHGMGYRYRLHHEGLPGRPDIVFKGRRKVIFVHGCFWHLHGCSNCRPPKTKRAYWSPKLEGNAVRDRTNRQRLKRLGWCQMVVWECQLPKPRPLVRKIAKFLGETKLRP